MHFTRRGFLASAAAAPLLASPPAQKGLPAAHPNFVLFVAEDISAWMPGCYGNTEIKTPYIDRLAATGVRFNYHFLSTPAASASRATLFTGRLARQHGIADYLTATPGKNPERGQAAPPASFATEVLLSDVLSAAGYRCAFFGRWDLGQDEHPGHGFSETATLAPGAPSLNPSLFLNGEASPETGFAPQVLSRHATAFLERQSAANPFFLVVSYPSAAPSYEGIPAKHLDLYRNADFHELGIRPVSPSALEDKQILANPLPAIRQAAAAVSALDEQIGNLYATILRRGFFENTLVAFISVGGQCLARHGLWGGAYASDPPNFFEDSVRTPLILSWPGRLPVQSVRPEMVSLVDFFPTACEALGVAAPSGRNLSGRSFLTLASGRPLPKRRPWIDLVFAELRSAGMARDNRFKFVQRPEELGVNEFFDLRNDPAERVNQYSNQSFVEARDQLAVALRAWHEKLPA